MKKIKILFVLFILSLGMLSAQSKSAAAANRKTAERCLSLAENYMLNSDWKNALTQAELGLAYDDSISDLFYVQAVAKSNLDNSNAAVIEIIEKAFTLDNWINYSKNSARILYADMLSETGRLDESLAILDMDPLLYSADSEFIRIKDYYRLGTVDSIQQARTRLNSSRKIYPNDTRFPHIFFMFEMNFMIYAEQNGTEYEIPELVQSIADSYIAKIPDYSTTDVEGEISALLFSEGEQQQRLLKAVGEKNQNHPLFAYAGLKTGILSEEKAVNLFFESSENEYHLNILESFASLLKDPELINYFVEKLNSFEGTLYIDNNLDLLNEIIVTYNRGRAQYIKYDLNNDGIVEITANCDYGAPLSLAFGNFQVDLFYDEFPCVSKVVDNQKGSTYHFLNYDYYYNPFIMIIDSAFTPFNVEFYIPLFDTEIDYPDEFILAKHASTVELPTKERMDSRVIYTVFDGRPVFAVFMSQGKKYAYATIEPGCPFIRYVDYDNDDIYETAETFDIDYKNVRINETDIQLIKNIFGENTFTESLYLQKIEIDRNCDTIIEFTEQYLENNGKISSWDSDGNGVIDYEQIRYPDSEASELIEETIIYHSNGLEYIALLYKDGIPQSIKYEGNEVPLIPGENENYFWLEEKGTEVQEQKIVESVKNGITDGAVQLVKFDDNLRISVIKIGKAFYCRLLPPSEITEEELLEY